MAEPEVIIDTVATVFGVDRAALLSRSRRREVLVPRQIAMYLCRRCTGYSLGRIGRAFNREHPAVSNAVNAVERRILEAAPLSDQIQELSNRLGTPIAPSLNQRRKDMTDPLRVELTHVRSLGGDRTPAFQARLELDGREVAFVQCDGLGGPPVLEWTDPQGEDAEALARWRTWCGARAENIYQAALGLGVHFPACRDRHGVDWVAEELAVFELYNLHQVQDDIDLRRRGAKA